MHIWITLTTFWNCQNDFAVTSNFSLKNFFYCILQTRTMVDIFRKNIFIFDWCCWHIVYFKTKNNHNLFMKFLLSIPQNLPICIHNLSSEKKTKFHHIHNIHLIPLKSSNARLISLSGWYLIFSKSFEE